MSEDQASGTTDGLQEEIFLAADSVTTEKPAWTVYQSSSILTKLAAEQSTCLRRLANQWQVKTRHELVNLGHEHLEHLHDCFLRSVRKGREKVDFDGFERCITQIFPPWLSAVDSDVSRAVLLELFEQTDCDADGLVDWQEFSSSVLKQAIGAYRNREGARDQIFQKPLPDDTYNAQGCYHKEMIDSIRYIPSIGKYVTCGRDGSFRVWSAQTRRHLRTVEISKSSPPAWITCCVDMPEMQTANNPKGILGVCCMDRTISFYELHQFKLVNRIELGSVVPLCCDSFSHKSTSRISALDQIVIGDVDGKIHLYSVTANLLLPTDEDLQAHTVLNIHADYVTACRYVKISSKGIIISTSADSKIGLIDAFDHSIKHYRGHEKAVQCFAFCEEPFNYIVSGGQDRAIQIWNPNTSRKISSLIGHQTCVQGLAYNAKSSHIISLSTDKEVFVWDPRSYNALCRVQDSMQYRPENTFSSMTWDEQHATLIVANSRFQVWRYAEKWAQSEPPMFVQHKGQVIATLTNSLFDCILTVDLNGLVISWNVKDGMQTGTFSCDTEAHVTCAIFDSTLHRLITGRADGQLKIYNWHDGTELNELLCDSRREITTILNTPLQEPRRYTIASGWDKAVYIWKDPPEKFSLQVLMKVDPGKTDVLSMLWITPQTVAAGCYDGSVVLWTTESVWRRKGRIQAIPVDVKRYDEFEEKDGCGVSCLEMMSPDHQCSPLLVTAGMDGAVRLWDTNESCVVGEFHADHFDESAIPQADGSRPRLAVVCMRCHALQRLIVTGDTIGQIKGFRTSADLIGEIFVLRVDVIEAADLVSADSNGFSDPYVILSIRDNTAPSPSQNDTHKTRVQEKTLCPKWNERFELKLGQGKVSEISKHSRILRCDVFDFDKFGEHDDLGFVEIPLQGLELNTVVDSWYVINTDDLQRKDPNSKLHLRLKATMKWNKPNLAFSWRAQTDAITCIDFIENGATKILSGVVILVTCGLDNAVHLWTMTGEHITTMGAGTWSQSIFDITARVGREQKVSDLLNISKTASTAGKHGHMQRSHSDKALQGTGRRIPDDSDEDEMKIALSKEVDPDATSESQEFPSASSAVFSRLMAEFEGHDEIMSRTKVTDIPSGTYDVLNQIVLDSLIRRRGRLPEETGLVFTRMHVEGKSEKVYTVKECRVHHWNLAKVRNLGILQTHRVNYGLVDTEQVSWQDRNSEFQDIIPARPHGTVATCYGLQSTSHRPPRTNKADNQNPNGMRQDSMRSGDPTREDGGARTALSTAVSLGPSRAGTAPTTPTGLPMSQAKNDQEEEENATNKEERKGAKKSEFNLNLRKVLTLSLPPHRPEGSWWYKDVDFDASKRSRTSRSTPRFDPTKFVKYPQPRAQAAPSPVRLDSLIKSSTASSPNSVRPFTARSRIETTVAAGRAPDLGLAPSPEYFRSPRRPNSDATQHNAFGGRRINRNKKPAEVTV